jgi:hypothetical protein
MLLIYFIHIMSNYQYLVISMSINLFLNSISHQHLQVVWNTKTLARRSWQSPHTQPFLVFLRYLPLWHTLACQRIQSTIPNANARGCLSSSFVDGGSLVMSTSNANWRSTQHCFDKIPQWLGKLHQAYSPNGLLSRYDMRVTRATWV